MKTKKTVKVNEDLNIAEYQNLEDMVPREDNLSQKEIDELVSRLLNNP